MRDEGRARPGATNEAEARQLRPVVTVTTDASFTADSDDLVARLEDAGLAVERRAFLPTPQDEDQNQRRRILLLARAGPLATLVATIAQPVASEDVVQAMNAALFPAAQPVGSATLQLKATGVFVSMVVTDPAELQSALARLVEHDMQSEGGPLPRPENEQRLIYVAGRWEVFER